VSDGFHVITYGYFCKYKYLGFQRDMAPCGRKLKSQGVSVWMSRDIRPKAVSRLRRELAASRSATSISDRLGVTGYSFWPASHRATCLESDRAYGWARRNNWDERATSYCSIRGGVDWALTGCLVPRLIPNRCTVLEEGAFGTNTPLRR
jgi:hypothetical protein